MHQLDQGQIVYILSKKAYQDYTFKLVPRLIRLIIFSLKFALCLSSNLVFKSLFPYLLALPFSLPFAYCLHSYASPLSVLLVDM